ncbi:hypothetical protein HWV62_34569 [Athelia sp. TMB]|nr:hypothetical protein HWV62_34569 [Athelia sp. TMB]
MRKLDPSPLITFTFRYRPLDVLEASGVIPSRPKKRKAVEEPKEEVTGGQELDEQDAAEAAREKALEEELQAIRLKRLARASGNRSKRMKLESLIPEGFVSGEVVDLT